jgi:hypothetical protein
MLKKILIALAALVGVIVVVGLLLPKDFVVEREIVIRRPKSAVFAQVKSLKSQNSWSPWGKLDPHMKLEYKGTDGTVGSISSWAGNKDVGIGEQEITNIVEGERVDAELRFKEPMQNTGYVYFVTEALSENETKVKWGMKGTSPFPINLLCLAMNMKGMIGKDFEKGLGSLKELLEKNP